MSGNERARGRAPVYARLLRLQRLRIGGLASFLLVECTVAVAILLALAEFVSWWAVLVLPTAVAAMVKINDLVGQPARAARRAGRHGAGEMRAASAEAGAFALNAARSSPKWDTDWLHCPANSIWATTWEHEANTEIAPRLGLPQLPVVHWPDPSNDHEREGARSSGVT